MKSYTLPDIMEFRPCWRDAEDRIAALMRKHSKTSITAIDVLDCPDVFSADAIWLVCQMSPDAFKKFAQRCADDAAETVLAARTAAGREEARLDAHDAADAACTACVDSNSACYIYSAVDCAADAHWSATGRRGARDYALDKYRAWLKDEVLS